MATSLFGLFRNADADDPLADVKALELWFAQQPDNDPLGFQEAVVRLLEDMGANRPKTTPNRVAAVLELDRISLPVQSRLLRQYLQPTLSDQVRQRLWHALDDLARWFAYTYETVFEALQEFFRSKKTRGQLPGIAARLFYYRGQQAKFGLFRYERWIPGKWKALHAGYETALKIGLARTRFSFAPGTPPSESWCVEHEYLQILLMQRINTGNLGAAHIEMAALWLRAWVPQLALAEPLEEGAGFWLDLGQGDGLLARRPQSPQGTLFHLDIAPLHKEISDGLVALSIQCKREGAPAIRAEAAERLALLERLDQLWRPVGKTTARRGERVHADRAVSVAVGLADIIDALRSTGSKSDMLMRRFRHGDPVEVASGRVTPTFGGTERAVIEFEHEPAVGWRMRDSSESGCRLVSPTRQAAQQKLGSLLGIQEDGDSRWMIGVVRRLKKFSGGQTELGIEFIARHSLLIAPKPAASRDSGYSVDGIDVSAENLGFDALYLPPMQTPGRAPQRSLLLPAQEFAERRRLLLAIEDAASTVELSAALERNKDWIWSTFEVVGDAP